MREKVRRAWRELELTTVDTAEFFKHYRDNLGGRQSHFYLNIGETLMEQAVKANPPQAEIIAVRRKSDESGAEQSIEAAILCITGAALTHLALRSHEKFGKALSL
jgi:hypothetical protein